MLEEQTRTTLFMNIERQGLILRSYKPGSSRVYTVEDATGREVCGRTDFKGLKQWYSGYIYGKLNMVM